TGVTKFAVRSDSSYYDLTTDGVLHDSKGGGWSNTQDFAIAADGTLYWLGTGASNNLLQKQVPGGWQNLATNVSRIALRFGTDLYYLSGTNLYHGGSATPSWANTQDFAIAADGTLYWLATYGLLQLQTATGWVDLDV